MKNIFITGANGFVGKNLTEMLERRGFTFTAGTREIYGDIAAQNNWQTLLSKIDVVVHLAARVHVMNETESDPMESFRKMNVEATVNLAKGARAAGVRRFIYISSIKVNGEATFDTPFKASDVPAPEDAYGISKANAEKALMDLHEHGAFEVVIIRPPLIYGPGVKANFEKLYGLIQKGFPLPFGAVENKRSLVSVLNLCDLIITCFDHPKASGEIFLIADKDVYSLRDLLLTMGRTLDKKPLLLRVPPAFLKLGLKLIGKSSYAERLLGNLHVDIKKTIDLLNWKPPFSFEDTYKRN